MPEESLHGFHVGSDPAGLDRGHQHAMPGHAGGKATVTAHHGADQGPLPLRVLHGRNQIGADIPLAVMHHRLREWLPLDDIRVCSHDDGDGCACRKPAPGLLLDAARDWQIDLGRSFMIGDREKDLIAGRRAGCRVILVGEQTVPSKPDFSAPDLLMAADWILAWPK